MNPNKQLSPPSSAIGYVPYFYESGRFLSYGLSPTHDVPAYRSSAARDFSSEPAPTGWRLDHPSTVEQVIAHGYFSVPDAEPETALLSDRRDVACFGLDDVISQIRGRRELYRQNVYELNQSMCEANNAVFRQEADQGSPADGRQRYSANKQIQELYEQQRDERVNLWRDESRLRLGLPEQAQLYLAAYRKLALLDDRRGDAE